MLDRLAEQLGRKLLDAGALVATAESCTGGWVAQAITDIAGSSQWFDRGFVSYSNQAKTDMLGVDPAVITKHGAVSEAVVEAMATGALAYSNADFSVAISGVAGPSGGTLLKPVGTVWFAWAARDRVSTELSLLRGNRRAVREQSVVIALKGLIRMCDE